jgi:hypothetical protein
MKIRFEKSVKTPFTLGGIRNVEVIFSVGKEKFDTIEGAINAHLKSTSGEEIKVSVKTPLNQN